LSLAGRVIIKNPKTGVLEERIWRHEDPIIQLPNLAIHLSSERNTFSWDEDTHLRPIIATSIIDQLIDGRDEEEEEKREDPYHIHKKHLGSLLSLIARELKTTSESIVDFDLSLYDTTAPSLVGIHKEFISSARLDNQMCSLTATYALLERAESVTEEQSIETIILYDHEEVGSVSTQGAAGTFTNDLLKRVYAKFHPDPATHDEDYHIAISKSLYISADVNHAQHPNYQEKLQSLHAPKMHYGPVLAFSVTGKFMTDGPGSAIIREIARRSDIPLQDFMAKQGTASGSTIGPRIAEITGMRTVDLGIGQLAMHSIREFAATTDAYFLKKLFFSYFQDFREVSKDLLPA